MASGHGKGSAHEAAVVATTCCSIYCLVCFILVGVPLLIGGIVCICAGTGEFEDDEDCINSTESIYNDCLTEEEEEDAKYILRITGGVLIVLSFLTFLGAVVMVVLMCTSIFSNVAKHTKNTAVNLNAQAIPTGQGALSGAASQTNLSQLPAQISSSIPNLLRNISNPNLASGQASTTGINQGVPSNPLGSSIPNLLRSISNPNLTTAQGSTTDVNQGLPSNPMASFPNNPNQGGYPPQSHPQTGYPPSQPSLYPQIHDMGNPPAYTPHPMHSYSTGNVPQMNQQKCCIPGT